MDQTGLQIERTGTFYVAEMDMIVADGFGPQVTGTTITRFLDAAKLLPQGALIGWQIDWKTRRAVVFANRAEVTREDFKWLFRFSADIGTIRESTLEDLEGEGRAVYSLRPSGESCATDRSVDYACQLIADAIEILQKIGATIRLYARGSGGAILFGLPGEMCLRLRTALKIALPGMTAEETTEAMWVPIEDVSRVMLETLRSMEEAAEKESNDRETAEHAEREWFQELPEEPEAEEKPSAARTLEELIGLREVKEQVRKITAFARMKRDMAARGVGQEPLVLNMAFVGNPGTAKTTVARILAGIFCELGLLAADETVEVGRADLVAPYQGQTADRVKRVFERAKGKLLFIDEAYSLLENRKGEYGDEAINTIVQEMENNRGETIVVFAGYPEQMEEFLSRNPGLRSRVPFRISFSDYSAEEMLQIVELEANRRGFSVRPEARAKVTALCEASKRNPEAGNGRFCRNLAEHAVLNYAARVYGGDGAGAGNFTLSEEDFEMPDAGEKEKAQNPIGFCA